MRVIGRVMAMLMSGLPFMILAVVMGMTMRMVLALDAMAISLRGGSDHRVVADRVRRRGHAEREPERQRQHKSVKPHDPHNGHIRGLAIGTLTKD
jgi:hypothetical protein